MTTSSPEDRVTEPPAGDDAPDAPRGAGPWVRRHRWVSVLVLGAAIGLVAVGVLVRSGDDEDTTAVGSGPSPSATTSLVSTTTTSPATTTTVSSTTTAPDIGAVPAVPAVRARPGGGSGEVVVEWDAVAGATGYRVLRSEAPGGELETLADLDLTTGTVTAAHEVINVWSEQRSYLPSDGAVAGPDRSPWFQVVEYPVSGHHCFTVIAYNAVGDGTGSGVVCASPPG